MDSSCPMYPTYNWVNAPAREDDSSSVQHTKDCHCEVDDNFLTVGGLNISQLAWETLSSPDESRPYEISHFVLDHIVSGNYDVFYVHGIKRYIVNRIILLAMQASLPLDCASYVDPDDDEADPTRTIQHVSFHKRTELELVDRTMSYLKGNKFYESVKNEYRTHSGKSFVDEDPEDSSGFIETYKLRSKERYVKFLSLFLPPLTNQQPPGLEHGYFYRNISLKRTLYTFYRDSDCRTPADITSKCSYFVIGSAIVTEGTTLLSSAVNEILTADTLTVVPPHFEDYGDLDNPDYDTVDVGELQFYDPEQANPLPKHGMTSFIYHSKDVVTHAIQKCEPSDTLPPLRKDYDYICGGRFFLIPIPEDPDAY